MHLQLLLFFIVVFSQHAVSQYPATASLSLSSRQQNSSNSQVENIPKKIRENLFIRVQPTKKNCYLGEPIIVTYKLYSRLVAESRITRQPSLAGFNVFELNDFVAVKETEEQINKQPYKVHVIKKCRLIPLQPGKLVLDPIELYSNVHLTNSDTAGVPQGNTLNDLFDKLSAQESAPSLNKQINLTSDPVTITVEAFPEAGRPAEFNGAVGNYEIKSTLLRKNPVAGETDTLSVEIKGSGNISMIEAPGVRWPRDFDTMAVSSHEQLHSMTGSKTFEYVFMPRKAGEYQIAPVAFSYFDPVSRSYKQIQAKQLKISVLPGRHSVGPNSNVKPQIKIINPLARWWPVVLALFVGVILYIVVKKVNRRKTEPPLPALENTTPVREDPLLLCKLFIAEADYKAFYAELNAALWKLMTVEVDLPPSEFNKARLMEELKRKGWPDALVESLDAILLQCERSVYLPDYQQDSTAAAVLEDAEMLVQRLW